MRSITSHTHHRSTVWCLYTGAQLQPVNVPALFALSIPGLYGLPKRNGKLKDISHFDAAFFGVHPKQANTMDPQLRLMLEIAYEAIVDGGEEFSNTGGSWVERVH